MSHETSPWLTNLSATGRCRCSAQPWLRKLPTSLRHWCEFVPQYILWYWIEVYISSPLASKASLCRSIFFIVSLASSDPSPQVYLLNQDAASLSPLGYHLSDQYYQWPYLAGDVSGISPILWYESYSSLRAFRCCQNSYSITSTTESSQFRHASLRYLWPSRSSSLQWTGHRSLCLKIASLVENSR